MPVLDRNYAFTQSLRCANKSLITVEEREYTGKPSSGSGKKVPRQSLWDDCDVEALTEGQIALIGYSLRSPDYRYTAYFYFNTTTVRDGKRQVSVDLLSPPFQQELFDHKNETLADFTHRELNNLAYKPSYASIVMHMRSKIIRFIQREVIFHKF
jgi:hypothetical protein